MDNIINKYFKLSTQQTDQIEMLLSVYSLWNEKVNLISRKDFDNFYERHVLHSLSIAKFYSFKKDTNIMDLGTGGGFPGIPLAIMFPDVQFHLVDSIGKKIKVVQEVVKELKLNNTIVSNQRAEDVDDTFDFIVTRAVSKLTKLDLWSKGKISKKHNHVFKNGLICLKGGDLTLETKRFKKRITTHSISDFFSETFFENKKIIHLNK
jgi:16S rRNA (guanine527-N7)-methyltransferase